MTKNELVEIVDRIYATWNQVVPQSSAKSIYDAWWRVIGDLTLEECHQAVDSLAVSDIYMPRPGTLRKTCTFQNNQYGQAPSPPEAWATLQKLGVASARGEVIQESLHECVSKAISLLGGTSALGLHTNGDRNSFTELYTQVVTSWENELAKIPSNKTSHKKLPE